MNLLLEKITSSRSEKSRDPIPIEVDFVHGFEKKRLSVFKRSITKKLLWPGQTVWKYTHCDMCYDPIPNIWYVAEIKVYLTDEEYIMIKLSA